MQKKNNLKLNDVQIKAQAQQNKEKEGSTFNGQSETLIGFTPIEQSRETFNVE